MISKMKSTSMNSLLMRLEVSPETEYSLRKKFDGALLRQARENSFILEAGEKIFITQEGKDWLKKGQNDGSF